MEDPMIAVTYFIIKDLTKEELATLQLVAHLETDPRPTICWEKSQTLFTEKNSDGIPKMHNATKECVLMFSPDKF